MVYSRSMPRCIERIVRRLSLPSRNILKLQRMRTRLARDLHDDIGSGLSKIVILSEVGQRGITAGTSNAPTAAQTLDRIAETTGKSWTRSATWFGPPMPARSAWTI